MESLTLSQPCGLPPSLRRLSYTPVIAQNLNFSLKNWGSSYTLGCLIVRHICNCYVGPCPHTASTAATGTLFLKVAAQDGWHRHRDASRRRFVASEGKRGNRPTDQTYSEREEDSQRHSTTSLLYWHTTG